MGIFAIFAFMKKYIISILAAMALSLAGCSHDSASEPTPPAPPPSEPAGRTVLVYMVASNNLSDFAEDDIAEMREGMRLLGENHPDSRLVVYHAAPAAAPQLKEISRTGTVSTITSYNPDSDGANSVSIARMRKVIADTRAIEPDNSLGIVMWSHGTGWLETSGTYNDPDLVRPTWWGDDAGAHMSVAALAQALDDSNADFIYFDCCLMGTVEIIYELRHTSDTIAAPCTELPVEGMPYATTVPLLFSRERPAEKAARATLDYYLTDPGVSTPSLAIGVYDTNRLEALAAATRTVLAAGPVLPEAYRPVPYFRRAIVPAGAYDMGDYFTALGATAAWHEAYDAAIIWHGTTPVSYGLDMSKFTGLGSNIISSSADTRLGYGYRNLQWWSDVVSAYPTAIQ